MKIESVYCCIETLEG